MAIRSEFSKIVAELEIIAKNDSILRHDIRKLDRQIEKLMGELTRLFEIEKILKERRELKRGGSRETVDRFINAKQRDRFKKNVQIFGNSRGRRKHLVKPPRNGGL